MSTENVVSFEEKRRNKKAKTYNGECGRCGGPRVICSPMGRECCYYDPLHDKVVLE